MSSLVLAAVVDAEAKRIVATLRNVGEAALTIGNLNLANIKFGCNENTGFPVLPWMSTHLPNADGLRILDPMTSVEFEYDYLREFAFPGPGKYSFWLIYDSQGFKDRFAGADGPHAGLGSLDEFRCKSEESMVAVSQSDYDYNQKCLRSLAI